VVAIVAVAVVMIVTQLIIWISMTRSYAKVTGMETIKSSRTGTNVTFSGTGTDTIRNISLEKGPALFRMTHKGDWHFIVWLRDPEAPWDDPGRDIALDKEFYGVRTRIVDIEKQGNYTLYIETSGEWTIRVKQPISESERMFPPIDTITES